MAGSLWISNIGVRRRGTTFSEIQSLFLHQITTKHIYEPLHSAVIDDDPVELLNELTALDFDVVGVINQKKDVLGFIRKDQLFAGNPIDRALNPISLNLVVTDSTPIYKLIKLLENSPYLFVMHGNKIDGIVTLADINKPIVRLYLFGIISLFEMHLNYWIDVSCPDETWREQLKPERLQAAIQHQEERKEKNEALSLLFCLQFCDKRDILNYNKPFLNEFELGREKFDKFLKRIENVRNKLAHSQESIHLEVGLEKFISSIAWLENFLSISERKIEESEKLKVSNKVN